MAFTDPFSLGNFIQQTAPNDVPQAGGAYTGAAWGAPAPQQAPRPTAQQQGGSWWYQPQQQQAGPTPAPSIFGTDTLRRASYDLNPTFAWQHLVNSSFPDTNAPEYHWAQQQYGRYYNDYSAYSGANPTENLTFTQYLERAAPQLHQDFQNAPASARGVTNQWLPSGRYTS
jgi:hypothetical protein